MFRENLHFSSAVRTGNRAETSGQGGWNDALEISEAIVAAFRNIELGLSKAGATWDHVIHINSYHVGGFLPILNDTIVKLYRRYMPNHAPI
jgi:enamine deaminase RidA (YjgF/YER057c/UK114 family)